jgi:hypothetical protein
MGWTGAENRKSFPQRSLNPEAYSVVLVVVVFVCSNWFEFHGQLLVILLWSA